MKGEFKVYKSGDFTVMPNYHLKDISLSLKAVGLLSKMLSLPENWDYSLSGLVSITKDGLDSVRSALNELKDHDYVVILKLRTKKGTFKYNYLVFENPTEKALKMQNKPDMDFPGLDEPDVVNQRQSNIKEFSINNIIDKKDKEDIENNLKFKTLINELINTGYITKDDEQIYLYNSLFENLTNKGNSYIDLYSAIHYISPRVVARNFIDENGKEIGNKFGYFMTAIETNLKKLENLKSQNENENFWDSFEL